MTEEERNFSARPVNNLSPPCDQRRLRIVELIISTILRAGVFTSFAVIIFGTVISFARHPDYVSSKQELARLTRPGAAFPHHIEQVVTELRDLRGRAIVALGLLLLIATPVIRVAVSVFAFIYQRDRVFVFVTLTVLCLLILSFVLGRVE